MSHMENSLQNLPQKSSLQVHASWYDEVHQIEKIRIQSKGLEDISALLEHTVFMEQQSMPDIHFFFTGQK